MSFRLGRKHPPTSMPKPYPGASIEIAPMLRRHVKEVSAIEHGVFPRPWSQAIYFSELSMPDTRPYFVALVDGSVVGFVGCMVVADEGHVTTLGVAPEWQHLGTGSTLLLTVARRAIERGAKHLTLEVRASNYSAQSVYRRFGFAPAGIRKNYYPEVNEDGIVMWAHDVDTLEYARRLEEIEAHLLRLKERTV